MGMLMNSPVCASCTHGEKARGSQQEVTRASTGLTCCKSNIVAEANFTEYVTPKPSVETILNLIRVVVHPDDLDRVASRSHPLLIASGWLLEFTPIGHQIVQTSILLI